LGTPPSVTDASWRRLTDVVVGRFARHPVLSVFFVALVVRVVAAVVVAVGFDGFLFFDDANYSRLAELAADGAVRDPYDSFLYERTATLLVPITGLYGLFGPVGLLGQLFVATVGAATAAAVTRLAREVVAWPYAALAGLIVALLPSQILWSSLVLKDAAVWAVLSALALVVALAARGGGRRLALLGVAAAGLLVLLGFLRLHSLEVACVAIVLAVLAFPRPRPLARLAGAAGLLVCVPFAFGMGVAGSSFVKSRGDTGYQRAVNAIDAESAVVAAPPVAEPPPVVTPPASTSETRTPSRTASARRRKSPRRTSSAPGARTPKAPDTPARAGKTTPAPAPAPAPVPTDDPAPAASSLAYLPTGVTVVALRPWPWESSSRNLGISMARAETIIWYPLLLLALIGLSAVWKHRRALAFPVLVGGGVLATYALTEGNLGTAYRHRGEFVWVVALLAAVGVERVVAWRNARRPPPVGA